MKTIYLCGGINGLTDAACRDWREATKAALADLYQFLDPMRRDYRGKEDANVHAIVSNDYADIAACDTLLANANTPSWGTAMEIHQAFICCPRKRVVVVCGQARVSPWLRYHSQLLVPTLEAAWEALKSEAVRDKLALCGEAG